MSSHPIPRTAAFWEHDPYRDVDQLTPSEPPDIWAGYDDLPLADPSLDKLLDHLLGKDPHD